MGKKINHVIFPMGIFTSIIIVWFLSGKIIDIPHGTHEGGIISAVGVFSILVLSLALSYPFARLSKSKKKNIA